MPEEQAFAVLVKIMYEYQLREMFMNKFIELHVKFYQLERLIEVRLYVDIQDVYHNVLDRYCNQVFRTSLQNSGIIFLAIAAYTFLSVVSKRTQNIYIC